MVEMGLCCTKWMEELQEEFNAHIAIDGKPRT